MPVRPDISSVLVIGSGPIVIGQACEFDYSGTQACRVLRAEGIRVILVNSNPATIMTDPDVADATYIEPITPEVLTTIISKERPDALLPTLGGQTALNAAMSLVERGVLDEYDVELIGASAAAINAGEDRDEFKDVVERCGAEVARSVIAHTMDECRAGVDALGGYPVVVRPPHDGASAAASHSMTRTCIASRGRGWRPPAPPRSSWRSRFWAGRSTSSSSCATLLTTWWSCAPSRTSILWECTPVTPSPWPLP